jgi:hypothetical protein
MREASIEKNVPKIKIPKSEKILVIEAIKANIIIRLKKSIKAEYSINIIQRMD